jgi:hypothetical protein
MKRVSNTKKLSYIEKKNKTGDDNKVSELQVINNFILFYKKYDAQLGCSNSR